MLSFLPPLPYLVMYFGMISMERNNEIIIVFLCQKAPEDQRQSVKPKSDVKRQVEKQCSSEDISIH